MPIATCRDSSCLARWVLASKSDPAHAPLKAEQAQECAFAKYGQEKGRQREVGFLEQLALEITESTLMADPAQAMETVRRLSAMGVSIAIDDFGTGYSSLAYLKRLAVNDLKVDRSFVRHVVSDAHDLAIVRSTISLAHELGLAVVAEGIEDQATWDLLALLGCDTAQGYFISRPLPAADFDRWLAESGWRLASSDAGQAVRLAA